MSGQGMHDGHRIDVSKDGLVWIELEGDVSLNDTGCSFADTSCVHTHSLLLASATRHYRVFGVYSGGTGGTLSTVSNVDSATTAAPQRSPAPTGLTVEQETDENNVVSTSQLNLFWTVPIPATGTNIGGYQVEVSGDDGATWTTLDPHEGTEVPTQNDPYEHTGLSAGDTWLYRVSVLADADVMKGIPGYPSAAVSGTTGDASDPVDPTAPAGLVAMADGSDTINLTWLATGDADAGTTASSYQIEMSVDVGLTWTVLEFDTGSTTTSYSHEDLDAETTLHYQVWAVNAAGRSGTAAGPATATTSGEDDETGKPTAPTSLMVNATSGSDQDSLTLIWSGADAPPDDPITGYQIEFSTDGDTWSILVQNTEERSGDTTPEIEVTYNDTDLLAGTQRWYRVRGINKKGPGAASSEIEDTTEAPTNVLAPTDGKAEAQGTTALVLTWEEPAKVSGSPVRHYQIDVSTNEGTSWTTLVANTEDAESPSTTDVETTYTHTGLTADTTRHYRVYAWNAAGRSLVSDTFNGKTAAQDVVVIRTAPSNIMVTVSGSTVTITWTDGAGAAAHAVGLVDRSDYSVAHEADVVNGTETVTFSDVQPGSYLPGVLATPGFAYLTFGDAETVAGSN